MTVMTHARDAQVEQGGAEECALAGFEPCEVDCDAAGLPRQIVYRGRIHWLAHPPMRWFERRNWWDLEDRVPRASMVNAVDRERWSVQVLSRGVTVPVTLELVRQQATGRWWVAPDIRA